MTEERVSKRLKTEEKATTDFEIQIPSLYEMTLYFVADKLWKSTKSFDIDILPIQVREDVKNAYWMIADLSCDECDRPCSGRICSECLSRTGEDFDLFRYES